jgi:membrane associated rhomboid family serine protease
MNINGAPIATLVLIATVGLSLYTMNSNHDLFDRLKLHPYSLVRYKRYFTVITSGFLHADLMHLIFNMISFLSFAFAMERMIGSIKFALIYFLSMIIADIPTIMKHKDDYYYTAVGASGAISGIIFSMILYMPDMRLGMMFIPIPIPAPIFGLLYLAFCYYADRNGRDNVNHSAHLWGALTGIALTIFLDPEVVPNFIESFF